MAKRKFRLIIYLNGYVGVGKRTIVNELCQLLLNAKVISNHLLIDTAAVVFEKNTREHELLYTTWRGALWSRIASSTTHDTIWIFIDYQPLSGTSRGYLNIAASRRSPFISIILDCAINESLKRAASGDTDDYNTEPKDLKALGGLREEVIFRFGGELEMELDETDLNPTEAARRICDHVYRVVPNNLPEQGV